MVCSAPPQLTWAGRAVSAVRAVHIGLGLHAVIYLRAVDIEDGRNSLIGEPAEAAREPAPLAPSSPAEASPAATL